MASYVGDLRSIACRHVEPACENHQSTIHQAGRDADICPLPSIDTVNWRSTITAPVRISQEILSKPARNMVSGWLQFERGMFAE